MEEPENLSDADVLVSGWKNPRICLTRMCVYQDGGDMISQFVAIDMCVPPSCV